MEIGIRGKQVEVTPALKDFVTKKLQKLAKFSENIGEVNVILKLEHGTHAVEVLVSVNGLLVRGEEKTSDMYSAIDLVVDKLERQLNKYKTRILRKHRGNGHSTELTENRQIPVDVEVFEDTIVRTKHFPVKPMPFDEAIMQMNLLGHDFFVFTNAETERVNVVYRRKDGDYGLIIPE